MVREFFPVLDANNACHERVKPVESVVFVDDARGVLSSRDEDARVVGAYGVNVRDVDGDVFGRGVLIRGMSVHTEFLELNVGWNVGEGEDLVLLEEADVVLLGDEVLDVGGMFHESVHFRLATERGENVLQASHDPENGGGCAHEPAILVMGLRLVEFFGHFCFMTIFLYLIEVRRSNFGIKMFSHHVVWVC